jgi:hypothetical protein
VSRRAANRLGLIVEGDTEFRAIRRLHGRLDGCPPIQALNLGGVGEGCTPSGIAAMVLTKIVQLRVMGCGAVLVCIDRERRPQCAPGLAGDYLHGDPPKAR